MHVRLDLVGGLAGDMFLAAAIDAGVVDVDALQAGLRTLGLGEGIEVVAESVRRGAISGTHVAFRGWDPAADADHRHLSTILEMIDASALPPGVKRRAAQMFEVLGTAESKIHDIPMETVHFHEVGAVDSILDFVSAAWVVEELEATWSVGDVPTGRGEIETAHGTIPVPAPAAAELLKGFSIVTRDVAAELVTPTGAAILRSLDRVDTVPPGELEAIGYGAGTRELGELSNVVRMSVYAEEAGRTDLDTDVVVRLACDVDDMTPEDLAVVADVRLFEVGALDVTRIPVQMKKGRLGTRITVLARPSDRDAIQDCLLRETTTFGVRVDQVSRVKLHREIVEVDTPYGPIPVKIGRIGDEVVRRAPEHDALAAAAREHGVPIATVRAAISSLKS